MNQKVLKGLAIVAIASSILTIKSQNDEIKHLNDRTLAQIEKIQDLKKQLSIANDTVGELTERLEAYSLEPE